MPLYIEKPLSCPTLVSNCALLCLVDFFLKHKYTEEHPGHIACDAETKSELVLPLITRNTAGEEVALGVIDLDCLRLNGFTDEDVQGLQKIVTLIVDACDWD